MAVLGVLASVVSITRYNEDGDATHIREKVVI